MSTIPEREIDLQYRNRYPLLKKLAASIETQVSELLDGMAQVDRVYFRAKSPSSFITKSIATDKHSRPKYISPLEDIEDQIAGRVLVFFRKNIDVITEKLKNTFSLAEHSYKSPDRHDAFSYESSHLVLIIPPHVHPPGWEQLTRRPSTFEMQVRTLFMHAWAEPEHDISYKSTMELTREEKRQLAWAASAAWGCDTIFDQLLSSLAARSKDRSSTD